MSVFITVDKVLLALWMIVLWNASESCAGKPCKTGKPFLCGINETCEEDIGSDHKDGTGHCECLLNYQRVRDLCLPAQPSTTIGPNSYHSVTVSPPSSSDISAHSNPDSKKGTNLGTSRTTVWWIVLCLVVITLVGGGLYVLLRHESIVERLYRLRVRQRYVGGNVLINNQIDNDDVPVIA